MNARTPPAPAWGPSCFPGLLPRWRLAVLRTLWRRRVPAEARAALDRLGEAGHQAYLVGGCVRDLLMGRPPADWDIGTDARPDEVIALFPGARARGRFGTVVLPRAYGSAEVTTFRVEGSYSDRRRPDRVGFVASLEADLSRRDFTCNAMALVPGGRLVDPFGGLAALAGREIRTVGDPHARFNEDALRLLRAVRFAARLGFRLHPGTAAAIAGDAPLLAAVSAERVRDELLKILLSPAPGYGLDLARRTGLLAVFLPEVAALPGEEWGRLTATVSRVPLYPMLRLAALVHRLDAAMATGVLRRLRLPNAWVDTVVSLIAGLPALDRAAPDDPAAIRRALSAVGRERAGLLLDLYLAVRRAAGSPPGPALAVCRAAAGILARGEPLSVSELAVDGEDVMVATGLPPGPEVGRILAHLLDAVLADPSLNRRERLLGDLRAAGGRETPGRHE